MSETHLGQLNCHFWMWHVVSVFFWRCPDDSRVQSRWGRLSWGLGPGLAWRVAALPFLQHLLRARALQGGQERSFLPMRTGSDTWEDSIPACWVHGQINEGAYKFLGETEMPNLSSNEAPSTGQWGELASTVVPSGLWTQVSRFASHSPCCVDSGGWLYFPAHFLSCSFPS